MLINPETLDTNIVYKMMSNTIFPRPIAWISTVGMGGLNLAPYSYFIPVSPVHRVLWSHSVHTKTVG